MTEVRDRTAALPALDVPDVGPGLRGRDWTRWVVAAAALAVAVGVVLRFFATSDLWLDESLSVNISRLPIARIPAALRQDGAPPAYYVLLHLWMQLFGDGNVAVRALSGIFSVAALPLAWRAGLRLGGRVAAGATLVLLATAPYSTRYATEGRMYSLVSLLVLGGFLLVSRCLTRPTPGRLLALSLLTGTLLLTHYWGFYLLLVVGGWLLWQGFGGTRVAGATDARNARMVLLALGGGGLLFLPWLPTFLFQLAHTGTPWGGGAALNAMVDTVSEYAGGNATGGPFLFLLLVGLIALALFARPIDDHRVELDFRTRPRARPLAIAGFATLALAVTVGSVTNSAYEVRYTAVAFPLVILLAGLGATALVDRRVRNLFLAAAALLGLTTGMSVATTDRTQAGQVGRIISAQARADDVVAYCPDQLGPAVSRVVKAPVTQLTYPRWLPPDRIDWVDYAQVNRSADAASFALRLVQAAGPHDIWLVWQNGYKTFRGRCAALAKDLALLRPGDVPEVIARTSVLEHEYLDRYPSP
ncbi:MAG TPA: glycosyltransferase family 39 protein [Acidimicrobiales bacterium]